MMSPIRLALLRTGLNAIKACSDAPELQTFYPVT